jgi:LmbE family N-acetylglucosaminyl deacetylase
MQNQWEKPQNILVILAHPDDPEFFCGGTIAKWTSQGHRVSYCLLTCGDKGASDPSIDPQELCKTRHKEQRAAAAVLGVEKVTFLDYPDGHLFPDINLRRDITREIRKEKPDIVVTCDPELLYARKNYVNHPDHRAAGQAVLDAIFPAAGNPLYFPELISVEGLEPHSLDEVWVSLAREPDLMVDITDVWKIKLNALLEHKSQIGEPQAFKEKMRNRHTGDSTPEAPRYEERFRRIIFNSK